MVSVSVVSILSPKMRARRMMSSSKVTRLLFMLALSTAASAQEWQFYGRDAGGTRSSPLKQINRQNVASLKRAWTYHLGEADRKGVAADRDRAAPFESTPLLIYRTPS